MQIQNNQFQKENTKFLHQFAFSGKAVLFTNPRGHPFRPMAKGVDHGMHWVVYKVSGNQAYGEVRIKNGFIKIVKVFPEGARTVWEASIGKDGRRPPFDWQEAVDAAISMVMCGRENCSGHWPPFSPLAAPISQAPSRPSVPQRQPSRFSKQSSPVFKRERPLKERRQAVREKPFKTEPIIIRRRPRPQSKVAQRPIQPTSWQTLKPVVQSVPQPASGPASQSSQPKVQEKVLKQLEVKEKTAEEVVQKSAKSQDAPKAEKIVAAGEIFTSDKKEVKKRGRPRKTDK